MTQEEMVEKKALEVSDYKKPEAIISLLYVSMEELKEKFPWILDCDIELASMSIQRKEHWWQKDKLIWLNGRFLSGIWKGGIWYYGYWYNGTWKKGTWENGIWKNGTWGNGTWIDGTWWNGIWKKGTWTCGSFHDGIIKKIKVIENIKMYKGKTIKDYKKKETK